MILFSCFFLSQLVYKKVTDFLNVNFLYVQFSVNVYQSCKLSALVFSVQDHILQIRMLLPLSFLFVSILSPLVLLL